MKKALIYSLVISFCILIAAACSKNGGGSTSVDCAAVTNKAFAADVNPIIQSVCAVSGCHAAGSTNGPGGLTDHSQVFNARASIRSAILSGKMPQGSTLSSSQKNSIVCWIDSGAPNN